MNESYDPEPIESWIVTDGGVAVLIVGWLDEGCSVCHVRHGIFWRKDADDPWTCDRCRPVAIREAASPDVQSTP